MKYIKIKPYPPAIQKVCNTTVGLIYEIEQRSEFNFEILKGDRLKGIPLSAKALATYFKKLR